MKHRTTDPKSRDSGVDFEEMRQDDDVALEVERARRRAKERRRQRRRNISLVNLLCIALTVLMSVPLMGSIKDRYSEYHLFQDQVVRKQAQLASIEKQHTAAKRKLAMLESNKGRAQMLVERGYVHPGERILIFPTPPRRAGGDLNEETSPSAPATDTGGSTGSNSARVSNSWDNFWRKLRGLDPVPTSPAPHRGAMPGGADAPTTNN